MNEQVQQQGIKWFVGLSQGQIYGLAAVIVALLSQIGIDGSVFGIKIHLEAPNSFLEATAAALFVVGTAMHIVKAYFDGKERDTERRSTSRPDTPTSIISKELAATLPTEGMTLLEISESLPPHPKDAASNKGEVLRKLTRTRIREAAEDGKECYYLDGRYYSRNDATVLG